MSSTFYIPAVNIIGENALNDAIRQIENLGFKHALIVTDSGMEKLGIVTNIVALLKEHDVESLIYGGVQPNPTVENVNAGLTVLHSHKCDCVISLGGGSVHDCAKGIALVATNGGHISDYEGVDVSKKPQLPLISINTTAGTASEMTRFCIITDQERHIKMAIVDQNVTPILSVNDPMLMKEMPASLTAATGMDALTHAIEAYVSTAASPITDACAIKAVEIIRDHLREAVHNGENMEAREQMAYAQFLAGMAFNNASLGYVHAMAHQLGGFYDLPHGVCNAVLLPHVQRYNAQVAAPRLKGIGKALGVEISGLSDKAGADAAIAAIVQLSKDVNIPSGLNELGAKNNGKHNTQKYFFNFHTTYSYWPPAQKHPITRLIIHASSSGFGLKTNKVTKLAAPGLIEKTEPPTSLLGEYSGVVRVSPDHCLGGAIKSTSMVSPSSNSNTIDYASINVFVPFLSFANALYFIS